MIKYYLASLNPLEFCIRQFSPFGFFIEQFSSKKYCLKFLINYKYAYLEFLQLLDLLYFISLFENMEFTPPETDFLTDSYSLENGGFRKWRGFGRTKNPPFSRFYCTLTYFYRMSLLKLVMNPEECFYQKQLKVAGQVIESTQNCSDQQGQRYT